MVSHLRSLKSIMAIFALMLFLCSCENDVKEVGKINEVVIEPLNVHENLLLKYSDSSYTRLQLEAPLSENFPQLEEPYQLFKKGIKVKFFNALGQENSRLKANYAKKFTNDELWIAKGDVVVVNKKGEQLNSEELFWDKKKEKIYSDAYVKITTPTEIIEGMGFEADQDFTNYTIKQVTGQIYIEDEEGN